MESRHLELLDYNFKKKNKKNCATKNQMMITDQWLTGRRRGKACHRPRSGRGCRCRRNPSADDYRRNSARNLRLQNTNENLQLAAMAEFELEFKLIGLQFDSPPMKDDRVWRWLQQQLNSFDTDSAPNNNNHTHTQKNEMRIINCENTIPSPSPTPPPFYLPSPELWDSFWMLWDSKAFPN